jgi:hypothetical protein
MINSTMLPMITRISVMAAVITITKVEFGVVVLVGF